MTTFHELLRKGASRFGARTAILFEDATLTHEDLLLRTETIAGAFRAIGIGSDDHVAIVMENSLECVLVWLASSVLGCTEVPLNTQYRGDLLAYLLRDSGTTVVACDAGYLQNVLAVAPRLPLLRLIIVRGGEERAAGSNLPIVRFDDCAQANEKAPQVVDAPERVILYTSGTTGPSKGVVHTQQSCMALARYNAEVLEYGQADRLLNFFPLYHQNARYTGVIPALYSGASIRLERRFSASAFWGICDADGTSAFNYLGSVLRRILDATPPSRFAGAHTVRRAFGAGATAVVWREFEQRLGIELVEVYGLTEAPMATVNFNRPERRSPVGSAGRAGELFEVAVVDEHDHVVRPGETGEIVLRPRRPGVFMCGYHNKDGDTVRACRNLWFHSGDRGHTSADGDLYFDERSKDSIRKRGENISAWEVESVLDQHPDVAESAVYAIASAEADEEVAAALVLRRSDADLAAILRFAAERLPTFAVPGLLRVMSELPRTATAKVQKAALREAGRTGCLITSEIEERAATNAAAAQQPGP